MNNPLFKHIGGNKFKLAEAKDLPFASKVAKSMYDYHIQNGMPVASGDKGSFTFYRKATDKQAPYVAKKSGDFIGNDGRYVHFGPYQGNSIMFMSWPSGTWPDQEAKLK